MRKHFILCLVLLFSLVLVGCGEQECQHNWELLETVFEANCITDGEERHICSLCEETKIVITNKTQHQKGEVYSFNEEGHFLTCTICEASLDLESHTMSDFDVLKEATPYEEGVMSTKCNVCDYKSTRVIPKDQHVASTEYGNDENYHWYLCSSHTECSVMIQKEEHTLTYGEVLEEPTATLDGSQKVSCEVCGYIGTVVLPATNHVSGEITFDNDYHWYICSKHTDCGEEIDKEEHDWVETTRVNATCDIDGSVAYDCSLCDATKIEVLTKNGHDVISHAAQKATCTEVGWDAYITCKNCSYSNKVEIPALGHSNIYVNEGLSGHYTKCNVCGTESANVAHDYSEWFVTTPASLKNSGLETEVCLCGQLGVRTQILEAHASFKDEFNLDTSSGIWSYGAIGYSWGSKETFTFTPLVNKNDGNDGWIGDGLEVKSGWVNFNSMLGIGYTVSADTTLKLSLRFEGGMIDTRIAIRIGIKDGNGNLYNNPTFYGSGNNVIEISEQYTLKENDTIYFIFSNEGSGYPNGELSIKLTEVSLTKVADFKDDFTLDSANGTWKYGSVSYQWGSKETFDFIPLTDKKEESWIGNGIEVKSGWINFSNMMGIAYTVKYDCNLSAIINMLGTLDSTRFSLRVGVKDANGNLYSNPRFYGSSGNTMSQTLSFELKANDTIYFIFTNEGSSTPSGELNISINNN